MPFLSAHSWSAFALRRPLKQSKLRPLAGRSIPRCRLRRPRQPLEIFCDPLDLHPDRAHQFNMPIACRACRLDHDLLVRPTFARRNRRRDLIQQHRCLIENLRQRERVTTGMIARVVEQSRQMREPLECECCGGRHESCALGCEAIWLKASRSSRMSEMLRSSRSTSGRIDSSSSSLSTKR